LLAAYRPVGLRDDEGDFVACRDQSFERGHGELGRSAENQP
jgi:hypothetical protein